MASPIPESEGLMFWIHEEKNRLETLYSAIPAWQKEAAQRLGIFSESSQKPKPDLAREYLDELSDNYELLNQMYQNMLGGMLVLIMSNVEQWLRGFCRRKNILPQGRVSYAKLRELIERELNIDFDTSPYYSQVTKTRIHANCFKHNGGRKNEEYVGKYGGMEDDKIEYDRLNYSNLIDDSSGFLTEIASKF